MSEESNSLNHYRYSFIENLSSYCFVTGAGVEYRTAFIKDETFNTIVSEDRFNDLFQIVIEKIPDTKERYDPKVSKTVEPIILAFFAKKTNSLLYVCSQEDKKHGIRSKLFDRWYNNSEAKEYILKENNIIEFEFEGVKTHIYTSFLYHIDNPLKNELKNAYKKIAEVITK